MADNKPKELVPVRERAEVARAVCEWLNTFPEIPSRVNFDYLGESGIAVSTEQSAYKSRQFIDGSYEAQYLFQVIYRDAPTSDDARLKMDELLTGVAEWIESSLPALGGRMTAQKAVCTSSPALSARYDDGVEDHQLAVTLTYEVNING